MTVAIFFLLGCSLDVNTSDSQESQNILQSKKSKLFLAEYELKGIDTQIFTIKEAWMEKCWKWKLNYGFKEKEEIDCYQLNLLLDGFNNPNFQTNTYGLNWDMENNLNGYFRSGGNVYTSSIEQKDLPDTFNISVEQINDDQTRKVFEHFTVIKR